jgi:hypothetical protein
VPGRAGHDVLQHGQAAEQADALQRAGDAEGGQLVRAQPGELAAAEADRAGLRADEAAQDVQQRGLPGAVRTDDPGDPAPGGGQRDILQGRQAAEADRDPAHVQRRG